MKMGLLTKIALWSFTAVVLAVTYLYAERGALFVVALFLASTHAFVWLNADYPAAETEFSTNSKSTTLPIGRADLAA